MYACRRVRYSRDELLACKDATNSPGFPFVPIRKPVPPRTRKKSQPTDNEGCPPSTGNREEEALASDEVEQPYWHRTHRQQQWHTSEHWKSTHYHHQRHRYPSGSHGDNNLAGANTALRPNPADSHRGAHGDWSKGCTGWRQRSYSGSDRSSIVSGYNQGIPSISRGRGGGCSGFAYPEVDDYYLRDSGRDLCGGRNNFPHRCFPPRLHQSGSGGHRASLVVCGRSTLNESEDFWQDDDWSYSEVDRDTNVTTSTKPRIPSDPKDFTDAPPAPCSLPLASSSVDVGAVELCAKRSQSESCFVDPPPGFDLPPKQRMNIPVQQHPVDFFPSTSTNDDADFARPSVPVIDFSRSSWYYVDSTGNTRGPFENQQMATWLAGGYLPLCVKIRRECDECFLTLVDHMNLAGRVPFWDGYSQPPITPSNLSSLFTPVASPARVPKQSSLATTPPPTPVVTQQTSNIQKPPFLLNPLPDTEVAPAAVLLSAAAELASGIHTVINASSIAPAVSTEPTVSESLLTPDGFGALPISNTSSTNTHTILSGGNSELEHLYLEAEALASHVAKVNAERKELAAKLAAISLTAIKLLTSQPPLVSGDVKVLGGPETGRPNADSPSETILQSTNEIVVAQETNPASTRSFSKVLGCDEYLDGFASEDLQKPAVNDKVLENISEPPHTKVSLDTQVNEFTRSTLSTTKKKKHKKKKPSPEQERQLAWDAEFARRKASSLAKMLAEESETVRMTEEEAASSSEQQTALTREQKRILLEHRKRETQRAKEEDHLGQLRLPLSARWGVSTAEAASPQAPKCASLRSIQANQAEEEALTLPLDGSITRQPANPTIQDVAFPNQQSRAQVVVSDSVTPVSNQFVIGKNPVVKPNPPYSLEPSGVHKMPDRVDRRKPSATASRGSTVGENRRVLAPTSAHDVPKFTTATSSSSLSVTQPIISGSIWDLPSGGKAINAASSAKFSKKNKKSATAVQPTSDSVSFAAKEQLAHWCESQLSFMPLSGVDLPTLIDLLCELEGTDQVVEFIEASLGRSKRATKFSKAFLEKRACIRDTVR